MGIWELVFLAFSVSMDAFAVSMCKGLAMKKATLKGCAICGSWFGGFQALMPLIGFFLGSLFADVPIIRAVDHWIAFGLLAVIGANMLKEVFSKKCDCEECNADLSFKTMFVMAIATSIDALAVGLSLAVTLKNPGDIYLAVLLIGATTFLFCAVGVKIGNVFGSRYEKKAQFAGGAILILLGLSILIKGLLGIE